MSKYKESVLKAVSTNEIKSTNQILKEVEETNKKKINWHMLYRVLMELKDDGKVERVDAKAGFFWKKK